MSFIEIKKAVKTILISISIILPILSIISVNEVYSASKNMMDATLVEIQDGWQYLMPDTGKWVDMEYATTPPINKDNEIVTIKVWLPATTQRGLFLFVKCRNQDIEAYYDGNLVYSYGNLNPSSYERAPGSYWHNIPINTNLKGKDVTFKLRSIIKDNSANLSTVYMGTPSAFFITQLKLDLKDTIPGFILIFVGLFTLLVFLFKRRKLLISLPLSMFSICIGIHSISITNIAKEFIYNNPIFWYYTLNITKYLMPVFFFMAVRFMFKSKKSLIIKYLWQFFLLFGIIALAADVLNIYPFPLTFKYYSIFLAIAILFISILIYILAANGNIYHKILRNCYTVLLLAGAADTATMFIKIKPWKIPLSGIGTLIFLLSMFFILERSFYEAEEKISNFSNEIKQKDANLIENQKLLQQTLENDKLKSEFFANVSHEFRTPLNILLSNLQLINHYVKTGDIKSDTKDINKYMGTMKQNCYRLLRLINNLIDMTKIASGYMHPIMKNCDIVKEVRDIVLSISEYAESKGLALNFYSNTESLITACDPEKMERIMLNLLSNAVKFTNKGGTITVTLNCSPDKTIITVSDTGIGIPEDKLASVFDRFSQVDMSLSKSYEGSGIGLSLVRSLVEMHGGNISVQSEPSKGSEFVITLPVQLAEEDETSIKSVLTDQKCFNENINIEFSDISK